MSKIIKPAAILLIICIVAAGLLGYVNQITLEPIAKQDALANEASMKEVLPDAASFGEAQEVNEGNITAVTPALDASGNTTGYAVAVTTKGFSAGLKLMFGVSAEDGSITGLSIVDNSNETPGLGAESSKDSFKSQFAGQSGNIAVTKDGGTIEALTGATITSRAIANAATEACEYVANMGSANEQHSIDDGHGHTQEEIDALNGASESSNENTTQEGGAN